MCFPIARPNCFMTKYPISDNRLGLTAWWMVGLVQWRLTDAPKELAYSGTLAVTFFPYPLPDMP